MLSREQAQAITRTVHLLRPGWNEEGIYAALGKVNQRDPFDVALAALRAAADPKAKTPGVIPTPGPHWNELEPATPKAPKISRDEYRARCCATCGVLDCGGRDHEFVPLTKATAGRTLAADEARAALAALQADLCSHKVPREFCNDHRSRAELAAARTEPAPTSEETA